MAYKHYFIRDVLEDPRTPSHKVNSIQFEELGSVDQDGGSRDILAVINLPKRKGTQAFGVKIPLNELREAVKWLDEKPN